MPSTSTSQEGRGPGQDQDDRSRLLAACRKLAEETRDLFSSGTVTEVLGAPTSALDFYRQFVSANRPVVFRGAAKEWPAVHKWKHHYLSQTLGDAPLTVSVTPGGYADAIDGDHFVMPHEEQMSMGDFLAALADPDAHPGVHYIQKQNSNLTDEFSALMRDVEEFGWAREAFGGAEPDAINFWMGDGRAVTSMHKDPYENIYCVVSGYKDFILHPPADLPWLQYRDVPQAVYRRRRGNGGGGGGGGGDSSFYIEPIADAPALPWISVDPLRPAEARPAYRQHATPLRVRVNEGDVLYLPSLWFHHLRQSHGCVAVNFWYDMDFDAKYNYFNFLSDVSKIVARGEEEGRLQASSVPVEDQKCWLLTS